MTHEPQRNRVSPEEIEAYAQRVLGYKTGEVVSLMIHLGDRLGLYHELAGGESVTAQQVAERTGLHERWVLEWLRNQTAAGLVEHRAGSFSLSPAGEAVLLDESNRYHMAGFFAVPTSREEMDQVADSFRTGLGRSWDAHGPEVACMVKRVSSPSHEMLPEILENLNGLGERLHRGIRVADVGCGCGVSTLKLAHAFPKSRFEGYDPSRVAIETAQADCKKRSLDNVRFHLAGGEDLPGEPTYDLVLTLDCIHDLPHPGKVIAGIRRALREEGVWIIKDVRCAARFEENLLNPLAPLFYGISVLYCMSSALSEEGGAGLGTLGFNPVLAKEMVESAGFRHFRPIDEIEDPINAFYEVRP